MKGALHGADARDVPVVNGLIEGRVGKGVAHCDDCAGVPLINGVVEVGAGFQQSIKTGNARHVEFVVAVNVAVVQLRQLVGRQLQQGDEFLAGVDGAAIETIPAIRATAWTGRFVVVVGANICPPTIETCLVEYVLRRVPIKGVGGGNGFPADAAVGRATRRKTTFPVHWIVIWFPAIHGGNPRNRMMCGGGHN